MNHGVQLKLKLMDSLIIFCAKYLLAFVVLVFGWAWLRAANSKKIQMAATVIIAGVLALIISRLAGKLYYDPRPFVSHAVKPLIPHAPDNGFPSDHALLTMTLTAVLYFYNRTWALVALILTIVVGVARVLAHIHSPIDIIGSFAISIACAYAARWLVSGYLQKKPEPANKS